MDASDDPGVEVHISPGAARVVCRGDLDLNVSARLGVTLRRLFVDGHVDVTVDLAGVTFMDSSALGVLVGGQRQARMFRGRFALVDPSAAVRRLLELTAMNRVLEVRESAAAPESAESVVPRESEDAS